MVRIIMRNEKGQFIKGLIPHNKGRKTPPETRLKQSLSKKLAGIVPPSRKGISPTNKGKHQECSMGEKNWNWKGGITSENHRVRGSLEYRAWREAVFKRDDYTCIWCGARCGNGKKIILNADHIKPFALFPELRLDVENGRTLCRSCHLTTETHGYNKKLYGKSI